ncbi:hypothetical protein ACFQL4_00945 [Halosimplex aquaticum]
MFVGVGGRDRRGERRESQPPPLAEVRDADVQQPSSIQANPIPPSKRTTRRAASIREDTPLE